MATLFSEIQPPGAPMVEKCMHGRKTGGSDICGGLDECNVIKYSQGSLGGSICPNALCLLLSIHPH